MELYRKNSIDISRITTQNYSTSFSLAVKMLKPEYRKGIYAIYGYVRFADEIVDTFFEQNQQVLLNEFRKETFDAIERKFSINPVIDSFQWVVNEFAIDHHLITAFLDSMEMDLNNLEYDQNMLKDYIYGSAEVVGLMCLRVFYKGEPDKYDSLIAPARKLGEAFQKVNFLRDAQDDFESKGRVYFKNIDFNNFDKHTKLQIEQEIQKDFEEAFEGVKALKKEVRFGVYLAYRYYQRLLHKIQMAQPHEILNVRFSVKNHKKIYLMFNAFVRNSFNLL